jgi:hypothetical protein
MPEFRFRNGEQFRHEASGADGTGIVRISTCPNTTKSNGWNSARIGFNLPLMSTPNIFNDLAQALAQWDNEGGAPAEPHETLSQSDERVLRALGAAVLTQWNELPTDIQRALFSEAATMSDPAKQFQLKQMIARFLHVHKDDR